MSNSMYNLANNTSQAYPSVHLRDAQTGGLLFNGG